MVGFRDGSVLAQLGVTDMRLPIQYALTYPQRWDSGLKPLDFFEIKTLTFQRPDHKKFPSLSLAVEAVKKAGTWPCALNAADEEAVDAFLSGRIKFNDIYPVVEKVVMKHHNISNPDLSTLLETERVVRDEARRFIKGVR